MTKALSSPEEHRYQLPTGDVVTKRAAPDDKRCQAMSRVTQERCCNYVVPGAKTCRFHGGNLPRDGSAVIRSGMFARAKERLEDIEFAREAMAFDLTPELVLLRVYLDDIDQAMCDEDGNIRVQGELLARAAVLVREIKGLVAVMRQPTDVTALAVTIEDTGLLDAIGRALNEYGGAELVARIGSRAIDILSEMQAGHDGTGDLRAECPEVDSGAGPPLGKGHEAAAPIAECGDEGRPREQVLPEVDLEN